MSEITLSDYTGYIFRELIKARQMSDEYARQVALAYAQDPVLQHFTAPRFKIPKMELTIPVLIAGARYTSTLKFTMPARTFVDFIGGKLASIEYTLRAAGGRILVKPDLIKLEFLNRKSTSAPASRGDNPQSSGEAIKLLHEALLTSNDLGHPEGMVSFAWGTILQLWLNERKLVELYQKYSPNNELSKQAYSEILAGIKGAVVVDKVGIDNLLVDPETNLIKNGSDATSVFTIKAELIEEGFFVRSVRDDTTGQVSQIVEFE
ncbi:hypothetical protein [Sphaerotilus sp.]|uniref:hypothetical protein n=1 Tax=Sphaerotilus sp. TaxID=2093942 RepID=UPI00286D95E3|nr:hypothetical protein [Sphaerotilus sp.]